MAELAVLKPKRVTYPPETPYLVEVRGWTFQVDNWVFDDNMWQGRRGKDIIVAISAGEAFLLVKSTELTPLTDEDVYEERVESMVGASLQQLDAQERYLKEVSERERVKYEAKFNAPLPFLFASGSTPPHDSPPPVA